MTAPETGTAGNRLDTPLPSRVVALDGLRGWAALGVLVFHLTWELFGVRYPVFRSLLALLLTGGGSLAVGTFFVTSGYLLTARRWRVADDKRLLVQLFKRYVRLTVPILASSLIFYLVLVLNVDFSEPASRIVGRERWLGEFGLAQPDLVAAITFALWRNYLVTRVQSYGPFLWTMAVQLWGSLIVMPIAFGHRFLREPYTPLMLATVSLLYLYPYLACFPLGAMLGLLQRDGLLFRTPPTPRAGLAWTVAFFALIVIASLTEGGEPTMLIHSLMAVLFVMAAMRSTPLERFLVSPVSILMGRLSFPIYLVQAAVMISLSSWLIIALEQPGLLNEWTALAVVLVSVGATLLTSWAFLPIEDFSVWLTRLVDVPFKSRAAPRSDLQ